MSFSAKYDFSHRVASFDFFTWLVHVQALGATEIVFDTRKYSTSKWDEAEAGRRYQSAIRPGPALAGLPSREGTDGERVGNHVIGDLAALPFRKLKSVKPAGTARYTVTLRKNRHNAQRDSDEAVWRSFAAEIGALVIEDYAVTPIHLHDRVALYAGAEMNFGVCNGPLALLFLTDYPYMMLNCINNVKGFRGHRIEPGTQLPWARPNQRLIWDTQEPQAIRRAFQRWRTMADAACCS